jgi:RsiW-degrading membrane proteinase PrsW (M82 family)
MSEVNPARTVLSRRDPALWVVLAVLAAGATRIGDITIRFAGEYPRATVTAVVLFGLLAVPFWWFVAELDFLEREPTGLRLLAFAWGGLVATAVSIPGSAALEDIIAKLGSPHLAADWGAALAGPAVEEIAKTLGVVVIVLIARTQINSVLDGIVYGALVGLGFQIIEDVVYALGAVTLAGQGDHVQPVVATFLLRGFLSGVWSHTLFGALSGAGVGYLVVRTDAGWPRRIGVALLAQLLAGASHALWNSPILSGGSGHGGLALLAVLVFKGLPPLVLILLLVRVAANREADYYVGQLARLTDPDLITPGERAALGSGRRRAAARRQVGRAARGVVRDLQQAQARLAVEVSRSADPVADPAVLRCGHDVRAQRRRLAALGYAEAAAGPVSWRHTASTVASVVVAIAVLWVALAALGAA